MQATLKNLAINADNPGTYNGEWQNSDVKLKSFSPIDNQLLATISVTTKEQYEIVVRNSTTCFKELAQLPAPKRGEIVRQIGEELRKHKKDLGTLVSLETGKILSEGEGEIQEAIDIADFAVGLSRQLYGKSMHSERKQHRMYEQWQPLGNVGIITAFNFPVAVWAWNAMIAAVCGNSTIWKPSEIAPLSALATIKICAKVAKENGFPALFNLIIGDNPELGKMMAEDQRLPLISATGSCRMGKEVAQTVAKRLGRSLLELGGNNAIILLADANQDLALRAILFGAVGTAGQRCTTTRRLLIEKSITDSFLEKLKTAYTKIRIGNPLEKGVLMGPLIHQGAVESYKKAIEQAKKEKAEIVYGGNVLTNQASPLYVEPTIIKANKNLSLLKEETFAPILYVVSIDSLDEAIELNNDVPQGLSSAIFTKNIQASEKFLSALGSDCGIANVNIGTSGAEIGGAFGGEKETGGGRESGSDSWKAYMRRQTTTINWSNELPLAQGVSFDS
ncbi:MAG: aldehyde dehydrogenase family protein [Proteobacteria bacterium]|nr:aldehyde dehydrogenase family protein [Pseudomonadota bacterium]